MVHVLLDLCYSSKSPAFIHAKAQKAILTLRLCVFARSLGLSKICHELHGFLPIKFVSIRLLSLPKDSWQNSFGAQALDRVSNSCLDRLEAHRD